MKFVAVDDNWFEWDNAVLHVIKVGDQYEPRLYSDDLRQTFRGPLQPTVDAAFAAFRIREWPLEKQTLETSPPPAQRPEPKVDEKPKAPPQTSPPADDRKCEICQGSMAGLHRLAKVCSEECKKEKIRRYQASKYVPKKADPIPPPTPPVPNVAESEEVKAMMNEQRRNFSDPWDCGMCRNAGSLCTMHESMTRGGKKPPLYRHGEGVPAS